MSMELVERVKKISGVFTGTIWRVPNRIWTTGFAKNKPGEDFHPGVVGRERNDGITATLIPGTSQETQKGTCVFKTRLTSFSKKSYFLISLSMPILIEDLEQLPRGWSRVKQLSDRQVKELKMQVGFCKGL